MLKTPECALLKANIQSCPMLGTSQQMGSHVQGRSNRSTHSRLPAKKQPSSQVARR